MYVMTRDTFSGAARHIRRKVYYPTKHLKSEVMVDLHGYTVCTPNRRCGVCISTGVQRAWLLEPPDFGVIRDYPSLHSDGHTTSPPKAET